MHAICGLPGSRRDPTRDTKGTTLSKKGRKRPRAPQADAREPDAAPGADALRYYTLIILVFAAVAVLLQILSLQPLKYTFWGFHFYAFIPLPVAIMNWAVLVVSAVVLLGPTQFGHPPAALDKLLERPAIVSIALAVAFTLAFYLFRSQQSVLGDAHPLMMGLPGGDAFHPRQPLTMWLQQQIYQALGGLFRTETSNDEWIAFQTTAIGSIAFGCAFVFIAVALGRALTRGITESKVIPWLVTLLLLGQGYALLFFGYVENYTVFTVAVALYLLVALLYLQGHITLQLVVVAFFVSMGLHLSTLGLLPSLLFLLAWGLRKRVRRADALMAAGVVVACAFMLNWLLGAMSGHFTLWKGIADITKVARTAQGGGAGFGYMFSWVHVRDFFNEHFLIGPLAGFFFLAALAYALISRRRWNATAIFLFLAAGSYFAGSWMMSEPLLGYARDWDLFAPAAVCYAAAAVYFMLLHCAGAQRLPRVLAFAVVFSFVQLAPYVRITHSQEMSLERFKHLPLRFGRTEVVVGNWYYRHSDPEQAVIWFKRALEVYPYNANAYGFLGTIYSEREDYPAAIAMYQNALQLRPDKMQFHNNLARAFIAEERYEEALPELEWLIKRDRQKIGYWRALKQCYEGLHRPDKVAEVNKQLLSFVQRELKKDPNHVLALLEAGILLSELGHMDDAIVHCQRALQLEPDNAAGLVNTAMMLTEVGRSSEARPLLEHFLELYPDHSHAEWAHEQLGR